MCILIDMKAIQVTFEEGLLAELDATDEVRRDGRSAVLRRAVVDYLRRRQSFVISEKYERAYGSETGLGKDFSGWEDEGQWPND